jgi:hypothetical protein
VTREIYGTTTITKQIGICRMHRSVVDETVVGAAIALLMTKLLKTGQSRRR